jgi:hypothetical protein
MGFHGSERQVGRFADFTVAHPLSIRERNAQSNIRRQSGKRTVEIELLGQRWL